ncbi:MAG: TolC family protein, partial [Planctomycetes bacterium]|nr:TolC family protein [Planctomycetota bacterium]
IDLVQFRSELVKPLPTGGIAGITFRTDYQDFHNPFGTPSPLPFIPGFINTTYRPAVDFTLEQPLLRGAGVPINQVRDNIPGSLLDPYLPGGPRVPGILLARIAHDEAQTEFERRVHALLFAVEEAYWQLYCAYWDLYSRETGMKQAQAAWQTAKARAALGGASPEDLAQIEEQFHSFRQERLAALGQGSPGRPGVLEAERRLRYVLGLPPEDGTRLIPADTPRTAPLVPDWNAAFTEALARRPELQQLQQDIRAAQLAIVKARDLLRPDLRFLGRYNVNGLGTDLGGAIENFEDSHHHDWELGLVMQVPIGFREGHAEVARAQLQLAQRFALLRDQEAKVVFSLQRSLRDLVQSQEEARIAHSQTQAAVNLLQARYDRFRAGRETIDLLLRAQREWVDALREENRAICNYNMALADFERQKGTIMQYENVSISEGPLPVCAQDRASEHIREWKRSLVLKKAPAPAAEPETSSCSGPPAPQVLPGPAGPQALPPLLYGEQHLSDYPEVQVSPSVHGRLGFSEDLDPPNDGPSLSGVGGSGAGKGS